MGESPLLTFGCDGEHLGQIARPALAKRRHEIRDPAYEAVDLMCGEPPPVRRAVDDLEALDAQVCAVQRRDETFGIGQQPIGSGHLEIPGRQALPLPLLDRAKSAELAEHLVEITHHHRLRQVEPADTTLHREVQGAPPQPALGVGADLEPSAWNSFSSVSASCRRRSSVTGNGSRGRMSTPSISSPTPRWSPGLKWRMLSIRSSSTSRRTGSSPPGWMSVTQPRTAKSPASSTRSTRL